MPLMQVLPNIAPLPDCMWYALMTKAALNKETGDVTLGLSCLLCA